MVHFSRLCVKNPPSSPSTLLSAFIPQMRLFFVTSLLAMAYFSLMTALPIASSELDVVAAADGTPPANNW